MAKNAKLSRTVLTFNRALVSLLCILLIISSTLYCSSSPSSATYQESFTGKEIFATVLWVIVIFCYFMVQAWFRNGPIGRSSQPTDGSTNITHTANENPPE